MSLQHLQTIRGINSNKEGPTCVLGLSFLELISLCKYSRKPKRETNILKQPPVPPRYLFPGAVDIQVFYTTVAFSDAQRPWEQKGSFFWLLEFKGTPFPQKKGKRAPLGSRALNAFWPPLGFPLQRARPSPSIRLPLCRFRHRIRAPGRAYHVEELHAVILATSPATRCVVW